LAGLFSSFWKSAEATVTRPFVPDGERIYCIGDIHGRQDLLSQLHDFILADAKSYSGLKKMVYLGDYIDRGAHSRQVIDTLLESSLDGFENVFLLGNHEQAMMDFIQRPLELASWLTFGGRETLHSYGVTLAHIPLLADLPNLAAQLEESLPASHRKFLENCNTHWSCGRYYFVHAGIRPGVALDEQQFEDQLWIRGEFLFSQKDHGAIIVHGHSISTQVEMLPNRIGIDTGAYQSGVLTCLVLEGEEQRLLQTGGH